MRRNRDPLRRGFSLLEAVAAVVVLAVAVPATLCWMDRGVAVRADAVNALRATQLANLVLEHVMADANSDDAGLGMSALGDPAAYLDTPTTGLRDRLAADTATDTGMGFSYAVAIGPLTDYHGTSTGGPDDLFRTVTVTVTIPRATGAAITMPMSAMVGAP